MRRLQKFNEEVGVYYSTIDPNRWDELFYNGLESFRPSEFRIIKSIIFPNGPKKGELIEVAFSNQRIKCISFDCDITAFKFMDELYGVMISSDKNKIRYECDTFDGVKQCLKNFKDDDKSPDIWKKTLEKASMYYRRINLNELRELSNSEEEIDPNKVKKLRELSKSYKFDFDMNSSNPRDYTDGQRFIRLSNTKNITIFIRQIIDEYFTVSYYGIFGSKTYLCDQFDGLLICLEDLLSLKDF